jgi:1,2-diacylglycerol 3-alpha-glucosyltransferase
MQPYRIAVASTGVSHVTRGIETWAIDLAAALRRRGIDSCLLQGSGPEDAHRKTVPCLKRGSAGNKWLAKYAPGFFWRMRLKSAYDIEQTTFALNLVASRKAQSFDILHTQDPHLAHMLDRCQQLGLFKPRVILAHGTEEPPEYLTKFANLQHLAPHHMEEIRDQQLPGTKWFVGPNFVDTDCFKPGTNLQLRAELGIPASAFVVLTSAAVKRQHKRVDYLINEFSSFCKSYPEDAHLIVAGASHEDTAELKALAASLTAGRVHFLLDQPKDRMPDILRAADLFVLCSLKEMMPIALLEALATGLPAIVSEHPVVSWMRGNGGTSIAMQKDTALATELGKWADTGLRAAISKKARDHAVSNFSESAVMKNLMNIYEEVLQ